MARGTAQEHMVVERYTYTFELHPSGVFGLEEPGKVVRPFGPDSTQLESDVLDATTWRIVGRGHGTVTREPRERIDERFSVAECPCWLRDNFLDVSVDADGLSFGAAWERAGLALRAFLLALSPRLGVALRTKLVQAVDSEGKRVPVVTGVSLQRVRLYGLTHLRSEVKGAAQQTRLQSDRRLSEALEKLGLALLLDDVAESWLAEGPRFDTSDPFGALAAERFLNYFKALTAILGDPSNEPRRWQTFYRELGMVEHEAAIESVKRVRNDQDVAHVLREGQPARVSTQDIQQVRALALTAVRLYSTKLAESAAAGPPQ